MNQRSNRRACPHSILGRTDSPGKESAWFAAPLGNPWSTEAAHRRKRRFSEGGASQSMADDLREEFGSGNHRRTIKGYGASFRKLERQSRVHWSTHFLSQPITHSPRKALNSQKGAFHPMIFGDWQSHVDGAFGLFWWPSGPDTAGNSKKYHQENPEQEPREQRA